MYKCKNCNELFAEAKALEFTTEYMGKPIDTKEWVCPHCNYDIFEKMTKCEFCGNWFDQKQSQIDECCDSCYWKAMEKVDQDFEMLDELERMVKQINEDWK